MIYKRKMEDWEWEEWISKYESWERLVVRSLFWFLILFIVVALVINMVMLTSIVKTYFKERQVVAQMEAVHGQI